MVTTVVGVFVNEGTLVFSLFLEFLIVMQIV